MKKVFAVFLILFFPIFLSASTVSYEGCAQTENSGNDYTIRMLDVQAKISINNANNEILSFTVNNLDPDFVLIDNYDAGTLSRSGNTIFFQISVDGSKEINISPWYDPGNDFYFVSLSDSHLSSTYEQFIDEINIINPYFSTNSGDIITGSGSGNSSDATLEPLYQQFITQSSELSQPHFTAPGNHDRGSNGYYMYEQYLGDNNYSFNYAGTHFTFTTSAGSMESAGGYFNAENYSWLENDVISNSLQKIIFFHHPLYAPWWNIDAFIDDANRDSVAQLLSENNTKYLIAGHYHGYDTQDDDNTFTQIITGGAGGSINYDDLYNHYVLMHVSGSEITQQVVKKDEFYVSKEEANSNDGTEDSITTKIYNDGASDWPWLRLKFKLNKNIEHFYAYDSEGNYLDYQSQLLDDYRVFYIDTDIKAYGYKEITVAKTTKMHQNVTNTVYSSGEVSYSLMPVNSLSETGLSAVPSSDSITLVINNWDNDNKAWQTGIINTNQTLSYSISGLDLGYRYQLKVNDKLYGYYGLDENNILSFEYAGLGTADEFELIKEKIIMPENVLMAPASSGGPQIRILDSNGDLKSQFFAYDENLIGGYQAIWLDVDGDRELEIAVVPQEGVDAKLKIFEADGTLLAQATIFNDYSGGYNLKAGDLNNDNIDEIVVSPKTSGNKIKVYKLSANNKLKLMAKKIVYADFNGGVNIAVGDMNANNSDEIIAAPYSGQEELKIFKLKNNNLKLVVKKTLNNNSAGFSGINIALGDVNKNIKKELITVPNESAEHEARIFSLTNKKIKLLAKKKIFSGNPGNNVKILSGDIDNDFTDEILFASNSRIKFFNYYNRKIYRKQQFYPYGKHFVNGINFALFDMDNDWNLELATAPVFGTAKINIYGNIGGKLILSDWFWGYGQDFTGGVNL